MKLVYFKILILVIVSKTNFSFGQNTPLNQQNNTINTNVEIETLEKKKEAKPINAKEVNIAPTADSKALLQTFESNAAQFQSSFQLYSTLRNQKTLPYSAKMELERVLQNMTVQEPKAFETLFDYYLLGQHDLNRGKALLKAAEKKPNDTEVKKQLVAYYFLLGQTEKVRPILIDIFQTNVFSAEAKSYAEDVLASCQKGSFLITHGFEDTYAALYVQLVNRKYTDIQILNLDWFNSPQFLQKLVQKGWSLPNKEIIDVSYLQAFCAKNERKLLHLALTLPKEYLQPNLSNLYIEGLTFQYSSNPKDLSQANLNLWRSQLSMELVQQGKHPLSANYLPFLIQLRQVVVGTGKPEELSKLEQQIQRVSRNLGLQDKVKGL